MLKKENVKYFNVMLEYINNPRDLNKLCRKHKISLNHFADYLHARNIITLGPDKQSSIDESVFDKIDSEEKAYWLGFIFADGYIAYNNSNFELSLGLKDLNHLEKFAIFCSYKRKIKVDSYRCRFYTRNAHLWETLNNYGCTPRKSLTLKFPSLSIFTEEKLIRHFIRGYFDGDGCLSWGNKEHTYPHTCVLGTVEFLESLQDALGIKKHRLGYNNKSKLTRILTFSGSSAVNFAKYLYLNLNIFLDRKLTIYHKYENCRVGLGKSTLLEDKIGEICNDNTEIIK